LWDGPKGWKKGEKSGEGKGASKGGGSGYRKNSDSKDRVDRGGEGGL